MDPIEPRAEQLSMSLKDRLYSMTTVSFLFIKDQDRIEEIAGQQVAFKHTWTPKLGNIIEANLQQIPEAERQIIIDEISTQLQEEAVIPEDEDTTYVCFLTGTDELPLTYIQQVLGSEYDEGLDMFQFTDWEKSVFNRMLAEWEFCLHNPSEKMQVTQDKIKLLDSSRIGNFMKALLHINMRLAQKKFTGR